MIVCISRHVITRIMQRRWNVIERLRSSWTKRKTQKLWCTRASTTVSDCTRGHVSSRIRSTDTLRRRKSKLRRVCCPSTLRSPPSTDTVKGWSAHTKHHSRMTSYKQAYKPIRRGITNKLRSTIWKWVTCHSSQTSMTRHDHWVSRCYELKEKRVWITSIKSSIWMLLWERSRRIK